MNPEGRDSRQASVRDRAGKEVRRHAPNQRRDVAPDETSVSAEMPLLRNAGVFFQREMGDSQTPRGRTRVTDTAFVMRVRQRRGRTVSAIDSAFAMSVVGWRTAQRERDDS